MLRDRILALARESHSAERIKLVSKMMSGKTFHHDFHFLYDLRTLMGPDPKVYLEIGVYNGGSLALMMQHPYETELHGVDPLHLPEQAELTFANIEKFNFHHRTITIHRNYSQDPELLRRLRGTSVDLLFIDGDHHGASVIRDFETYSPLVNKDGFIVFDDYIDPEYSPEVRPAVDLIIQRMESHYYPGEFEVIGSLPNPHAPGPNEMPLNSMFILQKTS